MHLFATTTTARTVAQLGKVAAVIEVSEKAWSAGGKGNPVEVALTFIHLRATFTGIPCETGQ